MESSGEERHVTSPPAPSGEKSKPKLDQMSREDLIVQIKRQVVLMQKSKAKCDELGFKVSQMQMFESKCEQLESDLRERDIQLADLRRDLKSTNRDKSDLSERLQCTELKLDTLNETVTIMRTELSDAQRHVDSLTEARDAAVASLKSSKDSESSLVRNLESLAEQLNVLNQENSSLESSQTETMRKLRQSQRDCDGWKLKVEELENEKDDYVCPMADVLELEAKIEDLESQLAQSNKDKDWLNFQLRAAVKLADVPEESEDDPPVAPKQDPYVQLQNALSSIQQLERDLCSTLEQKNALVEELAQVKDLQRFLEDESKELREEADKLKTDLKRLEVGGRETPEDILQLQTQISELQSVIQNRTDEMKIEEYERELAEQCELNRQLKLELDNYKSNGNSELSAALEALKAKSAILEGIHLQMDGIIGQLDDANNALSERERDSDTLVERLETSKRELSDLKAEVSKHELDSDKLEFKLAQLDEERVEYILHAEELTELRSVFQQKEFELGQVRDELESLSGQNSAFTNQNQVLIGRNDALTNENETLNSLVKSLTVENESLASQNTSLTNQNESLTLNNANETMTNQMQYLTDKLQSVTHENEAFTGLNATLAADNDTLNGLITSLTAEKESLASQITSLTESGQVREKMESMKEALTNENEVLIGRNEALTNENQTLNSLVTSMTTEKENLASQISSLTNENELHLTQNNGIETMTIQLQSLTDKLQSATLENQTLISLNSTLTIDNETLNCAVTSLTNEKDTLVNQITSLTNEIESRQNENNENEAMAIQLQSLTDKLQYSCNEIESLKGLNATLTTDNDTFNSLVQALANEKESLASHITSLTNENEAFKNEKNSENAALTEHYEALRSVTATLTSQLESLTNQNASLTNQNEELKNANVNVTSKNVTNPVAADQSGAVELAECRDKIEKLKRVVFKLKKDLIESQKLKEELNKVSRQHLSNFQSLQSSYDQLQDEFDNLKDKLHQSEQDVTSLTSESCMVKQSNSDLTAEIAKLKMLLETAAQDKKMHEEGKAELESKLIIARSEKEVVAILESKVKKLEDEIKMAEGNKMAAQLKLEENLKQSKQQKVLSLEISHYEAAILDLESKLKSKELALGELERETELFKIELSQSNENSGKLESKCLMEESRNECLKHSLDKNKRELEEARLEGQSFKLELLGCQSECERLQSAKEELKLELADSISRMTSLEETVKMAKENHSKSSRAFEARLIAMEEESSLIKNELKIKENDFENYKVRVHSVLKAKQNPSEVSGSGHNKNNFAAEKERLEKKVESLECSLENVGDALNVKTAEMETLRFEHDQLVGKQSKFVQEMNRQEQAWASKQDQLVKDKEIALGLFEAEKSQLIQQRVNAENSFQQEMSALKEEHQLAVDLLERQLELTEKEAVNYQKELIVYKSTAAPSIFQDDCPFDISTSERQDGEGSECTGNITPNYNTSQAATNPAASGLASFEQLLSGVVPTNDPVVMADNSLNRKKVDHLSELLNESEANNMRLSEQVRLLKEEIRRLERNAERGEEIGSNLEYLKNVVVKFVTLQEGNERQRLVPVLTAILKLSPDEKLMLQNSAAGDVGAVGAAGNWGSYLPRWSGLM